MANRDRWTVTGIDDDGGLLVHGRGGHGPCPPTYVRQHVELAYATTVHGAQGETVDQAHLLIGETTGAAAAYVGMTRGRHRNTAHLVAETIEEARAQWVDVFSRDRADLGPGHAAESRRRGHRPLRTQARRPLATDLQAAALRDGPRRPPEPIPAPPPTAGRRHRPMTDVTRSRAT